MLVYNQKRLTITSETRYRIMNTFTCVNNRFVITSLKYFKKYRELNLLNRRLYKELYRCFAVENVILQVQIKTHIFVCNVSSY